MTEFEPEPEPGRDREVRAERPEPVAGASTPGVRPTGRGAVVVPFPTKLATGAESGITPAEAEVLGAYNLHNG